MIILKIISIFRFLFDFNQFLIHRQCGDCAKGKLSDCLQKDCIAANGVNRSAVAINGLMPGPSINVCKNDRIIVDVKNHLAGAGLTLHWHGLHQKKTPWMDGVPMITQCPISSGNTFRYFFDATEQGTHFYHAHTGFHKSNGCFGKLIVREQYDPNAQQYDYDLSEHSILLSDWDNFLTEEISLELGLDPQSLLINGLGSYFDKKLDDFRYAPMEAFYVKRGKRHRFRLINTSSHYCPFEFCVRNFQFFFCLFTIL